MAVLSAFALLVAVFTVRASENGANREVDCEPQWHVGFIGEVHKDAQSCFEYEIKFTPSACQKETASLNPALAISLSFEFPMDSQMAAKNPFVVDEMFAAIKSSLTASQPFRVVPRSDRSVIEVPLQPISVVGMHLADIGMGTLAATTRVKLCSAALVPLTYGVCILQPVFKGSGNVLELAGDSQRVAIPLPEFSSLATLIAETRGMDSPFGNAARNRKLPSAAQPPMSFSEFRTLAEDILHPLRRSHEFRISNENEAIAAEVVNKDLVTEVFSEGSGDSRSEASPKEIASDKNNWVVGDISAALQKLSAIGEAELSGESGSLLDRTPVADASTGQSRTTS